MRGINIIGYSAALAILAAHPAAAKVDVSPSSVQAAAPTKPVVIKNLDAPVFQSDTKTLQAIVDKDQPPAVVHEVPAPIRIPPITAPIVAPAKSGVSARPAVTQAPPVMADVSDDNKKVMPVEEDGAMETALTGVRVFAIRWHDVFDIVFAGAVALFIRKLYLINREQYKIMVHCARASEDAARCARKSADVAEMIAKFHEKPDEAQGLLDLRLD